MIDVIKNDANNIVSILCEVEVIDERRFIYLLKPREVAVGKIDESNYFVVESNNNKIAPVKSLIDGVNCKNKLFYFYPEDIRNLKKKYEGETDTTNIVNYYSEISNYVNIAYKSLDEDDLIIESIVRKGNKDIKDLDKKIDESVKRNVNVNTNSEEKHDELSSIKRKGLSDYLKERIIGNDSLLEDISTTIVSNLRAKDPKSVKNILCAGPTGSGKTETFRVISEYTNIPITVIDCNDLTAEGYVGKGMDDIFGSVYAKCNGNIKLAERSILFLDEVDKIASRGALVTDIKVQQELLKPIEGFNYTFDYNKRKISLDTSFMTKVASGAFSELFNDESNEKHIGFGNKVVSSKKSNKILSDQDIIKYGFMPEFVGRFPIILTYRELDADALRDVLLKSKNSPLVIEANRFKNEYGIELVWDDDFINSIVEKAIETKAGGRSLKKIVDSSFIKLEGAVIDNIDDNIELPKVLKLNKKMIDNPHDFDL